MNQASLSHELDSELLDLIEEISNRLRGGEGVDPDAYRQAYPQFADQLNQLFPTLKILAELGEPAPADSSSASGGASSVPLGDFQIVREIGRGGMGIVYEAKQLSLGRTVALKVLPLAGMLSERQQRRFKNEARAAGTLSHPNIVPVYAVGSERGVHFYAMQFINGLGLDQVIRELRATMSPADSPEPTEAADVAAEHLRLERDASEGDGKPSTTQTSSRLNHNSDKQVSASVSEPSRRVSSSSDTRGNGCASIVTDRSDLSKRSFFCTIAELGIQIADALQYAHEEGVVHRDIKPGNLILDNEGKVWITDFGLAHLQHDASISMSGEVLGTLRYMSPEQASGRASEIEASTDVYSLGATLYEMLTLQPAFPGNDRQDLLRRIEAETPLSPRQHNSAIPRELEVITLKAMAKERSERYPSAAALAADLRCFLEHRPIQAKPPTLWQRSWKWSHRHHAVVVAAICLIVLTSIGLLASNLLIAHQRDRARLAAERAERQQKLAEANLDVALQSINDTLGELVKDQLKDVPQMQMVRADMAERATALLERLAHQNSNSAVLIHAVARGYLQSGKLFAAIGNHTRSQDSFERAIVLYKQLLDEVPQDNRSLRIELGDVYCQLGALLREMGQFAASKNAYGNVVEVVRSLARSERNDEVVERLCAVSHSNLGRIHHDLREFSVAATEYNRALAIQEVQVQLDPSPSNRRHLAVALFNLGGMQWETEKFPAAAETTGRAITLFRGLVKESPSDVELRGFLAAALNNQGATLGALGSRGEAVPVFREQILILEQLAADCPSIPGYRADLAVGYGNLGSLLRSEGDLAGSETAARSSIDLLQELVADHPDVPLHRVHLASYLDNLGNLFWQQEKKKDAIQRFRETVKVREDLVSLDPSKLDHSDALARQLYKLSQALAATGRVAAAEPVVSQMTEVLMEIATHEPSPAALHPKTVELMTKLAHSLICGPGADETDFQKASVLSELVLKVQPENADAWHRRGVARHRLKDWNGAVDALQHAVRYSDSKNASVDFLLAIAYHHLGNLDQARQWHEQGERWIQSQNTDDPDLNRLRGESAGLIGIDNQLPEPEGVSKT